MYINAYQSLFRGATIFVQKWLLHIYIKMHYCNRNRDHRSAVRIKLGDFFQLQLKNRSLHYIYRASVID